MEAFTTWDGQLISQEKPHGVTVVVYRGNADTLEFLILHRAINGLDYEGNWAWTPPSGARFPGEDVEACARRELMEETGLELIPTLTGCGSEDWWVYAAETLPDARVQLSVEQTSLNGCRPNKLPENASPKGLASRFDRSRTC